jgi:hypothetical protein
MLRFDHVGDGKAGVGAGAAADDAVARDLAWLNFLDRDDVAAALLIGLHHLLQDTGGRLEQHVGEEKGERLVADKLAGAPDRMAETERLLLAGEARLAGLRQLALEFGELGGFAARFEGVLELELLVEMVLDDALVTAGDEDEVLDAGLAGLIDRVLDQRAVDDRQHFLRHGLGGRKEAGTKARNRKHRSPNPFSHAAAPVFPRFSPSPISKPKPQKP